MIAGVLGLLSEAPESFCEPSSLAELAALFGCCIEFLGWNFMAHRDADLPVERALLEAVGNPFL